MAGRRIVERPAHDLPPPSRIARRPSVSSTRASHRERERDAIVGPSWERARRYEAYPTIRARAGLPALPRLAVLAGALAIAALALFFLPALLGVGGGGGDTATPESERQPGRRDSEPGADRAAGADAAGLRDQDGRHVLQGGEELRADRSKSCWRRTRQIKNADKIAIGDEIIIPVTAAGRVSPSRPSRAVEPAPRSRPSTSARC